MATRKKRFSLEDITQAYERRQSIIINGVYQQILELWTDNWTQVAYVYARRRLVGNRFLPRDIRESIDRISRVLRAKTYNLVRNGVKDSFLLSNEKNNIIEKKIQGKGSRKPPGGKKVPEIEGLFSNEKYLTTAVSEFIKRKNQGLNLSDRIWKLSNVWKKHTNDVILQGLKDGTPAKELAHELKTGVRKNLKPGRGVYADPKKNAFRVARNEINLAYANADYERWQQIDTIVAIQIRLSNRHPKYDMCDELKGVYPKDFHFSKWHVNCLCVAIPKIASQEVRDALMDYKLGIRDTPPKIVYVQLMPGKATAWMKNNSGRVNGWKSKPYWINLNREKVAKYFA